MAILIDEELEISPNPTELPRQLRFVQTLRATGGTETVESTYTLADEHDVWFEEGGERAKNASRLTDVPSKKTEVEHRIRVVRGPGSPETLVKFRVRHKASNTVTSSDRVTLQ